MRWVWFGIVLLGGCSDDGAPFAPGTGGETALTSGVNPSSDGEGTDGPPPTATGPGTSPGTSEEPTTDSTSPTEPEATTSETTSDSDGSAGTTGGGAPTTVCVDDEDCTLIDDCCSCVALHLDDEPPLCEEKECKSTTCTDENIPTIEIECRFGSCEFVPIECNPLFVLCDEDPPPCEEGRLPSVVEGCWGACVPAEACDAVPSCDFCPGNEVCVEISTQLGPYFQCEPLDPDCGAAADCVCMGEVCQDPFICADAGLTSDLSCVCPTC